MLLRVNSGKGTFPRCVLLEKRDINRLDKFIQATVNIIYSIKLIIYKLRRKQNEKV